MIPLEAAKSGESPASVAQSRRTGTGRGHNVPLTPGSMVDMTRLLARRDLLAVLDPGACLDA
ncbi:hypothetical protein AB0I10_29575 [Streptomyces sp. NPDC050636]|uniref:hypothetical protein n=1 Tax=Streptomyces sp. NPDC050636 TaxID=3154510 RepID=UPI00343A8124